MSCAQPGRQLRVVRVSETPDPPAEDRQLLLPLVAPFILPPAPPAARCSRPRPARGGKPAATRSVTSAPQLAEIGDETKRVTWKRRRVATESENQLTLHWRVPARAKGYSLGTARLTARDRAESIKLRTDELAPTPKTRGDCINGPRPCRYFLCRHHLMLDVHPESGSLRVNHPEMLPEDLEDTCSLDVADRYKDTHGTSLEHVGLLMGMTLERVRQIEKSAILDLKAKLSAGEAGAEPPRRKLKVIQ